MFKAEHFPKVPNLILDVSMTSMSHISSSQKVNFAFSTRLETSCSPQRHRHKVLREKGSFIRKMGRGRDFRKGGRMCMCSSRSSAQLTCRHFAGEQLWRQSGGKVTYRQRFMQAPQGHNLQSPSACPIQPFFGTASDGSSMWQPNVWAAILTGKGGLIVEAAVFSLLAFTFSL